MYLVYFSRLGNHCVLKEPFYICMKCCSCVTTPARYICQTANMEELVQSLNTD